MKSFFSEEHEEKYLELLDKINFAMSGYPLPIVYSALIGMLCEVGIRHNVDKKMLVSSFAGVVEDIYSKHMDGGKK